jgi:hypothetical protein
LILDLLWVIFTFLGVYPYHVGHPVGSWPIIHGIIIVFISVISVVISPLLGGETGRPSTHNPLASCWDSRCAPHAGLPPSSFILVTYVSSPSFLSVLVMVCQFCELGVLLALSVIFLSSISLISMLFSWLSLFLSLVLFLKIQLD